MSDSLVQPQKYKEIKLFSSKKHLWKYFWSLGLWLVPTSSSFAKQIWKNLNIMITGGWLRKTSGNPLRRFEFSPSSHKFATFFVMVIINIWNNKTVMKLKYIHCTWIMIKYAYRKLQIGNSFKSKKEKNTKEQIKKWCESLL